MVPTTAPVMGIFDPNNSPTFAMQQGMLYVWPKEPNPDPGSDSGADTIQSVAQSTTILPAVYADQDGVTQSFIVEDTRQPYLELYLYLRPPLFVPTQRFPLLINDSGIQVINTGKFVPIDFIPIFGRKHVTVGLRSDQPGAVFRLGLLNCICENAAFPGFEPPPFELPGGTSAALAKNQSTIFELSNPCADYLVIVANFPTPGGADIQVSAYD